MFQQQFATIFTLFFHPNSPVFSNGLYHIDQKSMTGIIVGVSIALACIVMCALILISKGRPRYEVRTSGVLNNARLNITSSDLCCSFCQQKVLWSQSCRCRRCRSSTWRSVSGRWSHGWERWGFDADDQRSFLRCQGKTHTGHMFYTSEEHIVSFSFCFV